jgi:hypothetical protein
MEMSPEERYAVESKKRIEAAAAVASGNLVDVVSADGHVTRGWVVDFSAEGLEVKPKGGFEFGWGYGILVPWAELVVIEPAESGVGEVVRKILTRHAEAEARVKEARA